MITVGCAVRLPLDPEVGEQMGEVLEIDYVRKVATVCIFDEYRAKDDADGLVEIDPDELEQLTADDLRDWEG